MFNLQIHSEQQPMAQASSLPSLSLSRIFRRRFCRKNWFHRNSTHLVKFLNGRAQAGRGHRSSTSRLKRHALQLVMFEGVIWIEIYWWVNWIKRSKWRSEASGLNFSDETLYMESSTGFSASMKRSHTLVSSKHNHNKNIARQVGRGAQMLKRIFLSVFLTEPEKLRSSSFFSFSL